MTTAPPPIPGENRNSCAPYAIGCGVVLLVLILILVGVVIWLFLPGGERIEMEALVGPESRAMVHVTDCAEDPGVVALSESVSRIMRDVQRQNLEQGLPPQLRGLGNLSMLSQSDWKPSYLPEVVVAVEELGESNRVFVAGAALDGLPKIFTLPFRVAIEKSGGSGSLVTYRAQTMLNHAEGVVLFFGPTAVLVSDVDTARATVDRVLDGAPSVSLLERVPPSYPEQWDAYGILHNRDGFLAALIRELDLGEKEVALSMATEQIEDGWCGMDIVSAEQVRAELVITCVDEASAQLVLELVTGLLESALAEIDDKMVDISLEGECVGQRAILTLDIVGLSRLIEQGLQDAMEETKAAP